MLQLGLMIKQLMNWR